MKIERGEVWWVNLDRSTAVTSGNGVRASCVISANEVNRIRATPVVIPLSCSAESAPPSLVFVPSAGKDSVAVVDQIRAVDEKRFVNRAGFLDDAELRTLELSVKQILQLP